MPSLRERLDQLARGESIPPIFSLLGIRLVSIEPGRATLELEVEERHHNPQGTLHGGVLCDLADAAMGMSLASTLTDDETLTTIQLGINYLRPVWSGRLVAVGEVVKAGRTVSLTECAVTDDQGRLVARATATQMTLRDERARGR